MNRIRGIMLLFMTVQLIDAGTTFDSEHHPVKSGITSKHFTSSLSKMNTPVDNLRQKQNKCLQTARLVGAAAGATKGLLLIYWKATGVSGFHGTVGQSLAIGIPSSIIGAYVGIKSTEWATKQIMDSKPKPGRAMLRGAWYGAINGTIIYAVSSIPVHLLGYYTNTIHYNISTDFMPLKILGLSVLGGMIYGGTFGAFAGLIGGPTISFYMEF